MAKLIYSGIMSLDGFVADESGAFDWAMPGEAAHRLANEIESSAGTYLYGRRMYEVMSTWETMDANPGLPDYILDFAETWRAADKVVYSRTLDVAVTARTRIERTFDLDAVREMKSTLSRDIAIAGPTLAAGAIEAGLVDELHVFIAPVVVGGGLVCLPGHVRLDLALREQRSFADGMVYLRYDVRSR